MAEVQRQTVTSVSSDIAPTHERVVNQTTRTKVKSSYSLQNLIYFIFGVLEFMLMFRFLFKLVGANPASGFVSLIYSLTYPFVLPFAGIFRAPTTQGIETTSILEPSTLVALLVYPLIAWGIVKLIAIVSNEPEV